MGASTGGLQVLRKDGEWIDAIPQEDELVINVGDMLERHTNNKLRSTIHRVINPPKEEWHKPRYSIPFFMHPRSDMRLDCLEECIDEDHPKQYEDITAGEFLHQRLVEIGLAKINMAKKMGLEDLGGFVFSTSDDFNEKEYLPEDDQEDLSPGEQQLEAHFSNKGRGGKTVTIIKGFQGPDEELTALGKMLKKKMWRWRFYQRW